jgi:hypothetical protein
LLLAASQFYRGGDYRRTAKVLRRVEHKYLSPRDQVILDKFHKDLAPRIAEGYALGVRMSVYKLRQAGRFEEAIDILKEHPYVMKRDILASVRCDLCLRAGDIEAAVYFSADANRFSNFNANTITSRSFLTAYLLRAGQVAAAQQFREMVLKCEPTSLDLAEAAVARFDTFRAGNQADGEELLDLIEHARKAFSSFPEATQADRDVRDSMAYGLLLAAATADRLRGQERALDYFMMAESFAASDLTRSLIQEVRAAGQSAADLIPSSKANFSARQVSRLEEIERNAYHGQLTAA